MASKRARFVADEDELDDPKRRRLTAPSAVSPVATTTTTPGRDRLSPLSDELLLRILSFLSLPQLLAVAPVSHRFYHLSGDSQLWKALYYARFVLPRAMRIPGFREGVAGSGAGHRLHYSGQRTLWADGRKGGLVQAEDDERRKQKRKETSEEEEEEEMLSQAQKPNTDVLQTRTGVNWKRQYKIRYNWSRGKCAVEELRVGHEAAAYDDTQEGSKMLVKVVEGIAITADAASGLRAWDLKTRQLLAKISIRGDDGADVSPSSMAIGDRELDSQTLDVAVGFLDGSFGVWRFMTGEGHLVQRYRHKRSSNGELVAMAFSYPYLLTATKSVLISLYTFELPSEPSTSTEGGLGVQLERSKDEVDVRFNDAESNTHKTAKPYNIPDSADALTAPYLLTSLNSHTSRPPLALSIRKMATTTIASIAYTFSTRQGWSIGIQDLHIRPSTSPMTSAPQITTTRIAYTTPIDTGGGGLHRSPPTSPATPRHHLGQRLRERLVSHPTSVAASPTTSSSIPEPGPTTLCYTHPYLLATLPDNTLVLHMCTSNASSLSISRGIRLWGHTSGISDAEITARGKAVSVSSRGQEMRVWELEGRANGAVSQSVEIRPGVQHMLCSDDDAGGGGLGSDGSSLAHEWDERRNWVGFDDEMVIVLKERKGGSESLMVYDFT
ncbi:hypothetical protein B0T17DRAFT_499401 [Bombardia bombarda]|uniref:F-box domain-containing protein n=1 Tax=Bombardia bombarda TaxID=252184 RepID=A0AA39T2C4_9PEZI|nr:hypothetical protein B0T17DRAFT_499401 [Bombardia bombarda]